MSFVAVAGSTFTFGISLEDQANAGLFKAAPTIAAGDFQRSINGGAFSNLDNLPTVSPAAGRRVEIVLSASETTSAAAGGAIYIVGVDASGAEWYDVAVEVRVKAADLFNPASDTVGLVTTVTNLTNLPATAALEATAQSILVDTGTTLPGALATIAGYVDTEVAAIKAKTDNLPASPAAVGSAMTLTAAYDAAKTAASQTSVDDLPTNAELAAAVGPLATASSIAALNDLDSTEVQAAAAAALAAYDPPTKTEMDNGLAALNDLDATAVQAAAAAALAAYDPPTKAELDSAVAPLATAAALDAVDNYVDTEVAAIKAVTDKLDTTLVQDGAVYDFTAAALAAAPSSSGGDATAANQTAILAALADVPTDVDTELTASHGAGVWGAAGSGLLTDTITVNDGTDPLDGVLVQVATDSNFSNIIRSGYTNGLGQVTFHYDAAGTYYGRAEIATFNVLTFEITVS